MEKKGSFLQGNVNTNQQMWLAPKIPMIKIDKTSTDGRKKKNYGLAMVFSSATQQEEVLGISCIFFTFLNSPK